MKNKIILLSLIVIFINSYIFTQTFSNIPISVEINQKTISGNYSIWTNNDNIIKPFIICEGFDPLGEQDEGSTYTQLNPYNNSGFLIDLKAKDYDIIILDLDNNTASIELNAELFIELLNIINQELVVNNSKHRIDVLGISMGGLIIRYALAKMETNGLNHRVENYISFDSPQRGANIPLGIQQMIDTYLGPAINVAEWIATLDNLEMVTFIDMMENFSRQMTGTEIFNMTTHPNPLDYSAAFQMSAVYMHDNVWRQEFLNNLGFPDDCRTIAVSMGSNMSNQGYNQGTSLLNYSNDLTLIDESITWCGISVGLFWKPLEIYNSANATIGDDNHKTFNASLTIQPFVNAPMTNVDFSKYENEHSTGSEMESIDCNIDNVPGAYWYPYGIDNYIDWLNTPTPIEVNYSFTISVILPWPLGVISKTFDVEWEASILPSAILGEVGNETGFSDYRFCFVPTLSALGVTDTDWFIDISQYSPYPHNVSITPFDAICYSNGNNYHASMPNDGVVYSFLSDEIIPNHKYIQNRNFTNSYTNVFEAESITIGSNVDPVPNRTEVGEVITDASSIIDFRVPQNESITLKPSCSLKGNIHLFTDPTYITKTSNDSKAEPTKTEVPQRETKTHITSTKIPEIKRKINEHTTVLDRQSTKIKLNEITFNIQETNIDVFPNPIVKTGSIYIKISTPTNIVIDIVSMQGIIVKNIINNVYQAGFYKENFDVSDLSNGIYFCKIYYNNEQKTVKLIIQK